MKDKNNTNYLKRDTDMEQKEGGIKLRGNKE
jgi:hypothetical protein